MTTTAQHRSAGRHHDEPWSRWIRLCAELLGYSCTPVSGLVGIVVSEDKAPPAPFMEWIFAPI
jgi:hypothetical protein